MTPKQICLNIILYLLVAVLLLYSGVGYWKDGRKGIAILTVIVAGLTIWQGIDNTKNMINEKSEA